MRCGYTWHRNGEPRDLVRACTKTIGHTGNHYDDKAKAFYPTRHIAYIENDTESLHRGGSCRTATCVCGWKGPQRSTLELAADDALIHEGSDMHVVAKPRTT